MRLGRAVIIERANAGIGPDDVGCLDGLCKIFAGGSTEIGNLLVGRDDFGRIALIIAIGCADEGEIALIGNREDDPAILILENI